MNNAVNSFDGDVIPGIPTPLDDQDMERPLVESAR